MAAIHRFLFITFNLLCLLSYHLTDKWKTTENNVLQYELWMEVCMKIQLIIDEKIQETEIQIRAKQYNEQIEQLMKQLQDIQTTTAIDGYLQQEIHMLKIKDIYYAYAEGAKVFLQTVDHEFESKRKLYELEVMLSHNFVRVSKSILVNIDKIASIQMGRIGSTVIILDDESSVHVSRTYLKELKNRLGIGRN